jgi:hypothetical protein
VPVRGILIRIIESTFISFKSYRSYQLTITDRKGLSTVRIAMRTFSITSPRITEDDERKERESLTPEEIDELEHDIHGTGFDIVETDDMRLQAVVQLDEAISMIPDTDKVAYLRALELCPELVRMESEPIRFLRSENYNPWVSIFPQYIVLHC